MIFFSAVPCPCLHTLEASDLGISPKEATPSSLYNRESVEVWRKQIKSAFKGAAFYALECGQGDFKAPKRGPVHVHVLAAQNDGLSALLTGTEKLKVVKDLKGIFTYLSKPSEPYSLESNLDWQAAKLLAKGQKAPRLRGWLTSKKRRAWNALPMAYGDSTEILGLLS